MQRYTAGGTALSSARAFDEYTLPLSPSARGEVHNHGIRKPENLQSEG